VAIRELLLELTGEAIHVSRRTLLVDQKSHTAAEPCASPEGEVQGRK
jgi:hypothetical protein